MYLYILKQAMKKSILLLIVLLAACGTKRQEYLKAENALDAGREFVNACQQGDFSKAAFFMVPGEKNKHKLQEAEKVYREKDRDGRQQSRTASLNISEVKDLNDSVTIISYRNSFDKIPQTLQVLKQNNTWLVNFSFPDSSGH